MLNGRPRPLTDSAARTGTPAAAPAYAEITARRRKAGRAGNVLDLMIAAIARVYGAVVRSRNQPGFESASVEVLNPWSPL
ncbi:MAG: hypothetical protein ACRD04_06750 [Terriglobales bacterium]